MASKKSGWVKSGEMQAKAQTKVKPVALGKSKPLSAAKKKEKEEERKKEEAERAAEVYADFVAEFENPTATAKAFVRGSTINPETREESLSSSAGLLYDPAAKLQEVLKLDKELAKQSGDAGLSSETGFPLPKPKKIKSKEKRKTNLELFKEELKRSQEERDERHKVKKQIADVVAVTGDPTPFIPEPLLPGQGSMDFGDPLTTNLYVGNLHPKMNEETLCHYFGKYGPLASVKIMWPRTEEERTRQKNCGFVAFMNREHAAKALDELGDKEIFGLQLKIGWGKSIPIPPAPFYVPPEMREHQLPTMPPPPSGLPFNAQRRTRPENGDPLDLEDCIVRVVIPHDKDLLRLIHRMIEFVVREGPEIEAVIMHRVINNSTFGFLFDCQSPAHIYYRWKLYTVLQGDSVSQWRTEVFQMFKGGSLWQPPPAIHHKAPERPPPRDVKEPKRGELTDPERDKLEDTLRSITPERTRIAKAMVYCLDHSEAAEEIVDCIVESLGILQTPVPIKVARLYLVSDILYSCSTCPVPNSSYYRKGFETSLPEVFGHLHNTLKAITGRMRAEQFKRQVMNCLRAWEEWAIYPPTYLVTLQNNFMGITLVAPTVQQTDVVPVQSKDLDGEPLDGVSSDDIDGIPISTGRTGDDVDGLPLDDVDGLPFDEGPIKSTETEAFKANLSGSIGSRWERDVTDGMDTAPKTSISDSGGSEQRLSQVATSSGNVSSASAGRTSVILSGDEERRQKLREIELKVMKYADQLEKEGGVHNASQRVKDYRERLLKDLGGTQESDSEATGDASSYDLFAGPLVSSGQGRSRSPVRSTGSSGHSSQRSSHRSRSRSRSPGRRRHSRSPKRRRHSRSRSRSPRRRRKSRSRSRSRSPKRRRRSDR